MAEAASNPTDRPAPGLKGSLIVFADDWGRHPSSCQHLVSRLLDRTDVTWVNTIGLRPPSLNWSTVTRAAEKLSHWTKPRPSLDPSARAPRVINPKMWPWFRRPHDRWLNRRLLERVLVPLLDASTPPRVAVTTLPIVAELIGRLPVEKWIYYCVDDFGQWPGLDKKTLTSMERELVEKVDLVVAAGDRLRDRIQAWRSDRVELLRHGVDLDRWRTETPYDEIAKSPGPRVVFWGLIDRRMDLQFLRSLSQRMNGGTIALVGPHSDPDPELAKIPHVRRIGSVAFDKLPAVAAAADVLVMPYVDEPVTRAMQPLKLLEYLATHRPVVVRDLPATRQWADCLDLAADPERFADSAALRWKTGLPKEQREARARLGEESWNTKAERFAQLLWTDVAPAGCCASGCSTSRTFEFERATSDGRIRA